MSSDETGLTGLAQGSMPQPSCPAFLSKLWLLVDDEGTDELIHWSDVSEQQTFQNYTG